MRALSTWRSHSLQANTFFQMAKEINHLIQGDSKFKYDNI
jgi:hypothetical protein